MKIRYEPDPILRQQCQPVASIDSATAKLCRAMIRCMQRARGIGLAAPQIGISSTLFVTEAPGDYPRVFINPQIIETSYDQVPIQEGCLSIPAIYYHIQRSRTAVIQAYNEQGEQFTLQTEGMLARVILHEQDHLRGVLFWDLLPEDIRRQLQAHYHNQVVT